jgi:NAD(P)-dependent dehydrogenase (short-subunit alcohol dehydrogenase family)
MSGWHGYWRAGPSAEPDGPQLFLAGDVATWITGHTVIVDGGWTTR